MRRRGVALLTAVIFAAAIAAIAVGAAQEGRFSARVAAADRDALAAAAAAEAGLARIGLTLAAQARGLSPAIPERVSARGAFELNGATPIRRNGAAYALRIGGFEVRVSVVDERGKVDVNRADPAQLVAAFRAAGFRDPRAAAAAAALTAARARRAARERHPWRLRARAIETLRDAAEIAELSRDEFGRVAPYLTVWSEAAAPDPMLAPEALFRALPLDRDAARQARAARGGGAPIWRPNGPAYMTATATARAPSGAAVTRRALLRVAPRATTGLEMWPVAWPTSVGGDDGAD